MARKPKRTEPTLNLINTTPAWPAYTTTIAPLNPKVTLIESAGPTIDPATGEFGREQYEVRKVECGKPTDAPYPAFDDGTHVDALTFAPGTGVITIPLPARDFIDLPWPSTADVAGKVPRYTIHAATMAEANTQAAEAERYALAHGAYAVGAPIKVVDVKRQARVEMAQDTLMQTGREAVKAWVTRYAEVYPMPEGLTVEGALAMMGVES